MKTSLKFLSVVLALGMTGAFALELVNAMLPAGAASGVLFAGLVSTLVLMTLLADYERRPLPIAGPGAAHFGRSVLRRAKAAHPLAA